MSLILLLIPAVCFGEVFFTSPENTSNPGDTLSKVKNTFDSRNSE